MSKKLILTPNAYKAGKVYAVKPINGTGDFDFVRNTGRTRVNVNGNIEELSNNIVALDYQNGCPEILLEPQRTNLFEYSQDFNDSYWTKFQGDILTDNEISPDGTQTADKFTLTDTAGRISRDITFEDNKKHTLSVFLKNISATNGIVNFISQVNDGSPCLGSFNLLNGSINFETNCTAKIKQSSNQYFRISITFNSLSGSSAGSVRVVSNATGDNGFTSGDSIYVWGAQLEKGELTSYIPTNGSTVTRNKDILLKDLTSIIQPAYTSFLEVVGDEGRLKIEDNDTGIDLPLNGSGKIVIQVDSQIKIIFPDNGQPQTELLYDKPDDLRNIDIVSKLAATRIGVIAIENGIQDVSNWISGNVSSYFIETDWSAETDLNNVFRQEDYDYFPAIDLSSGTKFQAAWAGNNLTSFPAIDLNNGTNFFFAWRNNNLTSFPNIDLSNGTDFEFAWQNNSLTSFPANMFDNNNTSDYADAFEDNALDQISVDNILISVNTSAQANNITNGNLGIQGGTNATPSQAGKDAADALFANGWTVSLNGYTPS